MGKMLKFDFEWVDPQGAKVPEFRATWAELKIDINGRVISRLYDTRLKSIRDGIFLPLYPLAEWIAFHWWSLLYESITPTRSVQESYPHRHYLRYAREGYALPDVSFNPLGNEVEIRWHPSVLQDYRVEFIAQSESARIPVAEVEESLSLLIESVIQRLHLYDITDSLLEQEWLAIESADADERKFCVAAARLGLDAYNLSDSARNAIIESDSSVPSSIADEFFHAADYLHISEQIDGLKRALDIVGSSSSMVSQFIDLRRLVPQFSPRTAPWHEGYQFARELRSRLGVEEEKIDSFDALAQALKVSRQDELEAVMHKTDSNSLFDVLVGTNRAGSPSFAIDKKRDDARRFAFCRGLFEFLTARNGEPLLVTRAQTERQQRNRAFAAEFLAPSSMIRSRIGNAVVESDEIDEIAQEFGVSPLVIEHQIDNHQLAHVVID